MGFISKKNQREDAVDEAAGEPEDRLGKYGHLEDLHKEEAAALKPDSKLNPYKVKYHIHKNPDGSVALIHEMRGPEHKRRSALDEVYENLEKRRIEDEENS